MKRLSKKHITLIALSIVLVLTATVSVIYLNGDKIKAESSTTTEEITESAAETTTETTTESTTESTTVITTTQKPETTIKKSGTTTKKPTQVTTEKHTESGTVVYIVNGEKVYYPEWMAPPLSDEELEKDLTCPKCHKREGDGRNGTCVYFLKDMNCPECGKFVPAFTCHTCGEN